MFPIFLVIVTLLVTYVISTKGFHDFLLSISSKVVTEERKSSKRSLKCYLNLIAIVLLLFACYRSVVFVHENIIPLPMAMKILNSYDVDKEVWEENIEIGEHGDLGAEHEEWSEEKGFDYEQSRYWQEHLWANWQEYLRLAVVAAVVAVLLVVFLIFSFFKKRKPSENVNRSDSWVDSWKHLVRAARQNYKLVSSMWQQAKLDAEQHNSKRQRRKKKRKVKYELTNSAAVIKKTTKKRRRTEKR